MRHSYREGSLRAGEAVGRTDGRLPPRTCQEVQTLRGEQSGAREDEALGRKGAGASVKGFLCHVSAWTLLPGQRVAMESFRLGTNMTRSVPEKLALAAV